MASPHQVVSTLQSRYFAFYSLSTAASRSLIQARGLYANNNPVPDVTYKLTKADLIGGRVVILRAGKNKLAVLAMREA